MSASAAGEIEKGIVRLGKPAKEHELAARPKGVVERFGHRVLPIDEAVAREWGRLRARPKRAGRPMPRADALVASTARTHSLVVVTRNAADFELADPWAER